MRLGLALALLALSWGVQAKPLIKSGDAAAELTSPCGDTVELTVTSTDPNYFSGNKVALQKLLGGARMAMSFGECPQATRINVSGVTAGTKLYSGTLAKANGWKLEGAAALAGPNAGSQPVSAPGSSPSPSPSPSQPGVAAGGGGFSAPQPDYATAYRMLKAAHHDVLADDDRWLQTFIALSYGMNHQECRAFMAVQHSNPITWNKQMDEARAKFRADLAQARGGSTTGNFTVRMGARKPVYDAERGGMTFTQTFQPNTTLASLNPEQACGGILGGMPVNGITMILGAKLPQQSTWFLPMSESEAERFINDTNTTIQQVANPLRRQLMVELAVRSEPPALTAGRADVPVTVLNARLIRVDKLHGPNPSETVAWTYPLGLPDNMPQLAGPDGAGDRVPTLNRDTFFLMALKANPEVLTDKQLESTTATQVYAEQRAYTSITTQQEQRKNSNLPPHPESVFAWDVERHKRPELARAIVSMLINPSDDLSGFEQAGFDKRKASILGVSVFSRDSVEGKDPEFLKHELKGTMRAFLQAAADAVGRKQALGFGVPISYDLATETLSFPDSNNQSLREQQPLYFGSLPAGNRDSYAIVWPEELRSEWLYGDSGALGNTKKQAPRVQGSTVHIFPVRLPYRAAMFALSTRLKFDDRRVAKDKAAGFASQGQLTARLIADFSEVLIAPAYSNSELRDTLPIARGAVERIELRDRQGNIQLTMSGGDLPKESTRIEFIAASDAKPQQIPFTRDLVDLLVLRHAPDKVTDDHLFAMLLARYTADAQLDADSWLRFFAPASKAGRQPTEQEFREMLPRFKSWAEGRAALVGSVVADTYFEIKPGVGGAGPQLDGKFSEDTCLYAMRSGEPNKSQLVLGRVGKCGYIAGEHRNIKGFSHRLTPKYQHQLRMSTALPVTPALFADNRKALKAELRFTFDGAIDDSQYQQLVHSVSFESIRYLEANSGAEIASISATQANTLADAAADRKTQQRAECDAMTSVEAKSACFEQHCALLFDNANQCSNHVRNLQMEHFQRQQGCQSRARDLDIPNGTPGFEAVVAKCLAEAPRSEAGPDVLGIRVGMASGRALELVRRELGIGHGGQTMGAPQDPRPFSQAWLLLTPDASQGVALFNMNAWGPRPGGRGEMDMGALVAAVARNMRFDSPPPASAIREGLIGKYGNPVWQSGGAMLWASDASCRGARELLQPVSWRSQLWPADRPVAMLTPDGPRPDAFEPFKNCGTIVYASYDGNVLETIAMDPGWFHQLPNQAFNREKSSGLSF